MSAVDFLRMTAIAVVAVAAMRPTPARAAAPEPGAAPRHTPFLERPQDDLTLLAVRIGRDELTTLLEAYPTAGGVLLPVGGLCAALGVPVEIDLDHGRVTVSGRHPVVLDVASRSVRTASRTFPADSACLELHRDDVYALASALEPWFSWSIDVDLAAATVAVESSWPLPIQEQAERRRCEWQLAESGAPPTPLYPRLQAQRKWWSVPFVDQTVRSTRLDGLQSHASHWDYATFAAMELLGMDADLRLGGDDAQPLADVAGGIGRRDPDPVLLGPLAAREFRLGEVDSPGLPLVTLPVAGIGGIVGNVPLDRAAQFDRHTFRGRVPPGWDVELYRDRELVAERTAPADGAYEFEVPLNFGSNAFRLMFHGPQGELREERHVFVVGPALMSPGQRDYQFVECAPRNGGRRTQAEAEVNVTRRLSLAVSAASLRLNDEDHLYAAAGARASLGRLFVTADAAADTAGGGAVEAGLQTQVGPFGVTARQAELRNFRSEVFMPQPGPITSRSRLRLDGGIASASARLGVMGELVRDRLVDGRSVCSISNRIGIGAGGFSLSHAMHRRILAGDSSPIGTGTQNSLLLSAQVRCWSVRGAVDYQPARPEPLTGLGLVAERALGLSNTMSIGLVRDPAAGETRGAVNLRREQGGLLWTARTEHGVRSGTSFSVALQVGLNRESATGSWYAHATPVAARGAATARVFLDTNGNGRWDAGEAPVEGARIEAGHGLAPGKTGPNGVLFLSGLPENQEVGIAVSPPSLEDPLWVPTRPGVSLVPRSGQDAVLDFPVRPTGEVTGTVRVRDGSGIRPRSDVSLELVDARSGQVAQTIRSAYDGFYEIIAIWPGTYLLRLAATEPARLHLRHGLEIPIVIPPEGATLDGRNVLLEGVEGEVASDRAR